VHARPEAAFVKLFDKFRAQIEKHNETTGVKKIQLRKVMRNFLTKKISGEMDSQILQQAIEKGFEAPKKEIFNGMKV
jgi:phosphotransferase system HPr-like phosphotransfer protein